jgi:HlyD family secretion protein
LERAQINLEYANIFSPVDGVVISRSVDVGQTVAASLQTPTLFTIATDLSQMQVNASVDEADIGSVTDNATVTFTVDCVSQ